MTNDMILLLLLWLVMFLYFMRSNVLVERLIGSMFLMLTGIAIGLIKDGQIQLIFALGSILIGAWQLMKDIPKVFRNVN